MSSEHEFGNYNAWCKVCGQIIVSNWGSKYEAYELASDHIDGSECDSISVEMIKPQEELVEEMS
jgi:hypothetical protein